MAQTITSTAMGRVNRRFLFLAFILAALSAVLVYAAVSRSDTGSGSETPAATVPVVVAKTAIPAGTRITADMLEVQQLPETAVGAQPFQSIESAVGNVVRYPIAANEQLLLSKVVGGAETFTTEALSYVLEEGTRALAIKTNAVVGAGGLVLPGDHVDILWVPEEVVEDHEGAMLVAENIEVLAVQQALVDLPPTAPGVDETDQGAATGATSEERVRSSDEEPIPDATTVTLMVTPEQARLIFCAEQSGDLRLAVRALGDDSPSGLPPATCMLLAPVEQ